MPGSAACPGCGAVLTVPQSDGPSPPDASAACAALEAEVLGFACEHPVMLRYHQLTVDTYAAQHAGDGTPLRQVGFALTGLWLALEHGFSGEDVRAVHRRMGRPTGAWPAFDPPAERPGWLTVVDVADAGLRARSEPGHARAVARWSESVWEAWVAAGAADAVEGMLRAVFLEAGRSDRLHGTIGSAAAVHRLLGLLQA